MKCFGCYKETLESYCNACKTKLFNGKKISHVLSFDPPQTDNLHHFQENTKRLSISGVQLKYSLRLAKNELILTDQHGQYLLKPIPPTAQIIMANQAPENEHLTMQLAKQVFKIPVAENALIHFKNGDAAYLTKRFDIRDDGSKYLQEDFAQISGKTNRTEGANYKYSGTYDDIGHLIRSTVPAYLPALESLFKLVLFNYLFSNGDAHLKNFSLIQTEFGDHMLSKAYDLLSTVMHVPNETDTALELYEHDIQTPFYQKYGYYGRPNFEELANRIGLLPSRAQMIIDQMLGRQDSVRTLISSSFLGSEAKEIYLLNYTDKIKRFEVGT